MDSMGLHRDQSLSTGMEINHFVNIVTKSLISSPCGLPVDSLRLLGTSQGSVGECETLPYLLDVPYYLNNRQRYCLVWSESLGLFTDNIQMDLLCASGKKWPSVLFCLLLWIEWFGDGNTDNWVAAIEDVC